MAHFFERDGVVMINVTVDASTAVDLKATKQHKALHSMAWAEFEDSMKSERAHNEDGTFKADDPDTPENEAFKPAKKTRKKKAK